MRLIFLTFLVISVFAVLSCNNHEQSYENKLLVLCQRKRVDNWEILTAFRQDLKRDKSPKNAGHLRNVELFDSKIDSLIDQLDNEEFDVVKSDIENFLDKFLKKTDPEFDYKDFLKDTDTRPLLELELLSLKEAFVQNQFSKLDFGVAKIDFIKAFFIPDQRVVKDGELFKTDFILGVTSTKLDLKMEVLGKEIIPVNGIGQVSFTAKAEKKGLNEKLIEGKVILRDSTYTAKLKYWVQKD
jgi:hypothetical protein